ncbi:MAG TPA: hypothetical protein VKB05_01025 [Pyrinomonadaceae bacterium]|nr:hypothetical protein [Pyrinomonadaceae bacterium]
MRIPNNYLDCVCFICVKVARLGAEEDFFIGTGFFCSVPSTLPGLRHSYLVTDRHVIRDAKAEGYSEFYVRLNMANGRSVSAVIPDAWIYPENPAVDLAVLPVTLPSEVAGIKTQLLTIKCEDFVTEEVIKEYGIGVGDNLFITGLFSQRWGYQRNIPIVRTGIIASMPDEPFPTKEGELYDGYLIETRSIGGLSGSPVYVYLDAWRPQYHKEVSTFNTSNLQWRIYTLGIVRGHWDLERQDEAVDVSLAAKLVNNEIERLNTGIAVVTPIREVQKILQGEELMKHRERGVKNLIASHEPRARVKSCGNSFSASSLV